MNIAVENGMKDFIFIITPFSGNIGNHFFRCSDTAVLYFHTEIHRTGNEERLFNTSCMSFSAQEFYCTGVFTAIFFRIGNKLSGIFPVFIDSPSGKTFIELFFKKEFSKMV